MPISFRCEKCDQLLRVPDDAAGKQAKCPSCAEVVTVPTHSTEPPPQPAAPIPPTPSDTFRDPDPSNPYSAPTSSTTFEGPPPSTGPLTHRVVDVGDVMNVSWEVFKTNMGVLIGAFLVLLAVGAVFAIVQQIIMGMMFGFQQPGVPMPPDAAVMSYLTGIPGQLVQIFLAIGMVRINLAAARGQNPEIGMLFSGGDKFLPILGGSILLGLIYAAGFVLCIIPGIIAFCGLWMQYFFILDRDVPVIESFSQAWAHSKGNRVSAFLLFLINAGLVIVGALALCVGLLFTLPFGGLLWPVAYLQITGQPTVTVQS